jgi:hypothetical protein
LEIFFCFVSFLLLFLLLLLLFCNFIMNELFA